LNGPFFKKSESFTEPSAEHQLEYSSFINTRDHGTDGPLNTTHSKVYGASHAYWHATFHKLGVETNKQHTSGSNVGVWTAITAVDSNSRVRSFSAKAYYLPNSSRPNLVVLTEAIAQEILLETSKDGWTATGVRFHYHGEEYHAKARKEVILSCGSVQSPQLLELSGIGNPDVLQAAGIEVKVVNKNVGEHLQEHMSEFTFPQLFFALWPELTFGTVTATIYEIIDSIASPEMLRYDPILAEEAMKEYTTSQSGVLTAIPSSIAYLPTSKFMPPAAISSLASRAAQTAGQHSSLPRQFTSPTPLGQMEYNFDVSNYSSYYASVPGKRYATMLQMLQYPFSKGSIHIPPRASERPTTVDDKPVIDPKYYEGEGGAIDFEVMVAAQKFGVKICETEPLSKIIVRRVFPPVSEEGREEEDLAEFVRNYTITDWHPVGTCSMGGKAGAEAGVVDSRLRVYGIKGLRVVDASIMPLQVSAHIQATVYAIGEKGASLILKDWAKEDSGVL
jgi:choline dehydrogenase-like flavoprotein